MKSFVFSLLATVVLWLMIFGFYAVVVNNPHSFVLGGLIGALYTAAFLVCFRILFMPLDDD